MSYDITGGAAVVPERGLDRAYVASVTVNYSILNGGSTAAAEVGTIITIPGPFFLQQVQWQVTQVEGAVQTFDVGDSLDPNGWVAAADANALGSNISTLITAGEYYSANESFTITNTQAADNAIIVVRFLVWDLRY